MAERMAEALGAELPPSSRALLADGPEWQGPVFCRSGTPGDGESVSNFPVPLVEGAGTLVRIDHLDRARWRCRARNRQTGWCRPGNSFRWYRRTAGGPLSPSRGCRTVATAVVRRPELLGAWDEGDAGVIFVSRVLSLCDGKCANRHGLVLSAALIWLPGEARKQVTHQPDLPKQAAIDQDQSVSLGFLSSWREGRLSGWSCLVVWGGASESRSIKVSVQGCQASIIGERGGLE